MTISQKILDTLSIAPTRASIEKLIGEDGFRQLSFELGGRRIYIPVTPTENTPIAVCIGLDKARLLAEVWGAMEYEIPVLVGRRQAIRQMLEEGKPVVRISATMKVSIRSVRKVNSDIAAEKQLPLL